MDHPEGLAAGPDEYVKAGAIGKFESARTACFNRIDSHSAGRELDNLAIYADRDEWNRQCPVSIEIDAF